MHMRRIKILRFPRCSCNKSAKEQRKRTSLYEHSADSEFTIQILRTRSQHFLLIQTFDCIIFIVMRKHIRVCSKVQSNSYN